MNNSKVMKSNSNELNHYEAAKLCKIVSESELEVEDDLEYCVFGNKDIVVIRGTELDSLKDILVDLNFIPEYNSVLGIGHRGFINSAVSLVPSLEKELNKDSPITLIGHSLGGALVLLCAALLRSRGFTIKEVVTFGAPRTLLWFSIKNCFKDMVITQYQYKDDVVCTLPRYYLGFRHARELVKLGKSMEGRYPNHSINYYIESLDKEINRIGE